ncbi:hypothetical protein GHT07_02630 [Caenimonas koreensis DSM 17982]|uniref:Uncharacterized protein n=1 Tax=Caenimonas koreensis DSM 17982 TaxID=1121255 RepID=A0A844APR8_9BURK|nr:hypothetical protein [Caenimonas koreensis]MRD46160.1 hypothetical protein [Caenimonas koreensis DSM 17982]
MAQDQASLAQAFMTLHRQRMARAFCVAANGVETCAGQKPLDARALAAAVCEAAGHMQNYQELKGVLGASSALDELQDIALATYVLRETLATALVPALVPGKFPFHEPSEPDLLKLEAAVSWLAPEASAALEAIRMERTRRTYGELREAGTPADFVRAMAAIAQRWSEGLSEQDRDRLWDLVYFQLDSKAGVLLLAMTEPQSQQLGFALHALGLAERASHIDSLRAREANRAFLKKKESPSSAKSKKATPAPEQKAMRLRAAKARELAKAAKLADEFPVFLKQVEDAIADPTNRAMALDHAVVRSVKILVNYHELLNEGDELPEALNEQMKKLRGMLIDIKDNAAWKHRIEMSFFLRRALENLGLNDDLEAAKLDSFRRKSKKNVKPNMNPGGTFKTRDAFLTSTVVTPEGSPVAPDSFAATPPSKGI